MIFILLLSMPTVASFHRFVVDFWILTGGRGFHFHSLAYILFGVAPSCCDGSPGSHLPNRLAGAYGHYKKRSDLRHWFNLAAGGILGALVGAGITRFLTGRQLRIAFGIYSILIAITMYAGHRKDQKNTANGDGPQELTLASKYSRSTLFGILSGIITATFGTSGSAPILAGLMSIRMPLKLVLGTSLVVVFVNTCSALGAHLLVGQVDLTLVLFLACGS